MRTPPRLSWLWIGLCTVLAAGCGGSDAPSGDASAAIEDARGYVDGVADRIRADARAATEEAKQRLGSASSAPAEADAASEPAAPAPGDGEPAAPAPGDGEPAAPENGDLERAGDSDGSDVPPQAPAPAPPEADAQPAG